MPVQIIDNFDLTSAKPMDNRIVVGPNNFYTNKDDIQNKYEGLRIWELPGSFLTGGGTNTTANGVAYVWTGTSWIGENTTSITGGGSVGQVAYFNTPNSIQASNIYFSSQRIGIGTAPETGTNGSVLVVAGTIKSTGGTIIGSSWDSTLNVGLTNINASNLALGTVPIGRLPGSTINWILTADSASSTSYKNPSTINVGSATTLQTTRTIWGQNFNGSQNVSGDITLGGDIYRAKSIKILSGGVDSSASKFVTVQFASGASVNKIASIPSSIPNNATFAFLEQSQTFTVGQTMGSTLTVNGSTIINNNLTVSGSYRAFIGAVNSSSGKLVVGGSVETQNGGLYNNLYYGGSPADWRRSSTKPGYGFFYQEYASENKYVFYVNTSGTVGTTTTLKEVYKIDPSSSTPQLEVQYGLKPKLSLSYTAPYQGSTTLNHNLGYIPIVVLSSNGGNLNPFISGLTTTQVTIWNWPVSGSNASTGTVYFW